MTQSSRRDETTARRRGLGSHPSVVLALLASLGVVIAVALSNAEGGAVIGPQLQFRAGEPDPMFSGDGLLTRDFFGHDDYLDALAVTRAGGIVLSGEADRGDSSSSWNVVLAAYREDGSVESSFGSGGMVEIKGFGAGPRIGSVDIVEQPDGKLLLIGSTPRSAAVVRLWPNGRATRRSVATA
jgi:hypothetical protein